jgi:hypothetical protein
MIAGLLTCGMAAIAPTTAQAQEVTVLLEKGGPTTLVGCFLLEQRNRHDKYVLANPTIGPATSVTDATCTAAAAEQLELEDVREHHMDQPMLLGRWVEISGKLGKPRDGNDLREMHVKSFRAIGRGWWIPHRRTGPALSD